VIVPASAQHDVTPSIGKTEKTKFVKNSILDYMLGFRWHVLPMMNPDGYTYTFEENRFWSKNRRPPTNNGNSTKCFGVNLNRNFPSHFGEGPTDPCERSYIGELYSSYFFFE
jgi:hypothetical protein